MYSPYYIMPKVKSSEMSGYSSILKKIKICSAQWKNIVTPKMNKLYSIYLATYVVTELHFPV